MPPLKVTKRLQAHVNLNGMLVDGCIIDKEIACTLPSNQDLVKLVGMTSYLVVMTCYLVITTCQPVGTT